MTSLLVQYLSYAECVLCAGALALIITRRQIRNYLFLALFLAARLMSDGVMTALLARHHGQKQQLYMPYFYVYWASYALEAVLLFLSVYGIYRLAMAPLPGLQRLGRLVFRWAAAISLAVSVGLSAGPHVTSSHFIVRVVTQLQQTTSIVTLCLLLFVCFAIRPMGLSFRSRIFGTMLGLGFLATANLGVSAWMITFHTLYSTLNLMNGLAICLVLLTWTSYFTLPEPKRRMIVLPTTSPFLRWNQISQALGDDPGFVAVAGIPPEMFADAEIEVMKRASNKMLEFPERADLRSAL